jgi:hypothetical protein
MHSSHGHSPSTYATFPLTLDIQRENVVSKASNVHNAMPVSQLDMADLELLNHWSTSTANTLSHHPAFQMQWRIRAPQVGFSSQFVLRAILAFASLHMAYLKPYKRDFYYAQAEVHHNIALRAVTPNISRLIQEDYAAIHLFSCFTCLIACAKPRKTNDYLLMEGEAISEWLISFRGTKAIIGCLRDYPGMGPLAPMFIHGERKARLRNSQTMEKKVYIQDLEQLLENEIDDPMELGAYRHSVDELNKSFTVVFELPKCEMADVFIWFYQITDEYLVFLRRQRPAALVIFAYYCVILKQLEWTWWIEGWSAHIMGGIYDLLDDHYRVWLRWPIEQLGWIPPTLDAWPGPRLAPTC